MAGPAEFYDDEVIDYRYYFDLVCTVLLKHYRVIGLFCIACVASSVLYVQSQSPSYTATVTLHIAQANTMFSFDQWMWNDDEKFQDTQIGILQSKKLMRRVAAKSNAHEAERITPASFDAGIAKLGKQWLANLTQDEESEIPPAPIEDQIAAAADEISSLIGIAKPPGREYSNLLNVSVTTADPNLSTKIANTIADVYIELVFENEIESARKSQEFLTDRLSILREDLRIAEERIQDYREEENIVLSSSGVNEVDQELSALSDRYFEARENRLRKENLYQQVHNVSGSRQSWENLPAITNQSNIRKLQSDLFQLNQRKGELSKRYGSRHNRMIALESEIQSTQAALSDQVRDIIEGIRNEYELARKIEVAAEQTLNSVRNRKQELGRKEFEYNELTQDVEAKREVYSIFLERLNQDGAAGPLRNDNIWVADPAIVPGAGYRTPLSRAGIVALILSFGFAVGIGLLFELTSNKISSVDDVEKKLGVPLIGFLPLIAGGRDRPGTTLREYLTNPHSRFSEALRTVRTSITLSTIGEGGCHVYLVTSSQMSEGKSSVALSLATAMGQTSRVLIIDGDLRRPTLERVLIDTNHKHPGLADVIADSASIEEAIMHREEECIDALFAGSRTLKPLELLSSSQFITLIRELSDRYDNIIIDSPPCVSVSDAYVLATQADSVIYVTKANTTLVPVIRSCIARFNNIDTNVTGLLLNQVDFDAAHNYSRYQNYYEYHGYSEDHPTEATAAQQS